MRVRREEDAGLLMTDQDLGEDEEEASLPPDYASVPGSSRGARRQDGDGDGGRDWKR